MEIKRWCKFFGYGEELSSISRGISGGGGGGVVLVVGCVKFKWWGSWRLVCWRFRKSKEEVEKK